MAAYCTIYFKSIIRWEGELAAVVLMDLESREAMRSFMYS
jgi:hypothetical protein